MNDNPEERRINGYRRIEDKIAHQCIQQLPINDIRNIVAEIKRSMARQENETKKVYKILFGDDYKGGMVASHGSIKQSLGRAWWFIGVLVPFVLMIGIKLVFF